MNILDDAVAYWRALDYSGSGDLLDGTYRSYDYSTSDLAVGYIRAIALRRIAGSSIVNITNGSVEDGGVADITTGTLANALPLRIGAAATAGPSEFFTGEIFGAALFRRALSTSEIQRATHLLFGGTEDRLIRPVAVTNSWEVN